MELSDLDMIFTEISLIDITDDIDQVEKLMKSIPEILRFSLDIWKAVIEKFYRLVNEKKYMRYLPNELKHNEELALFAAERNSKLAKYFSININYLHNNLENLHINPELLLYAMDQDVNEKIYKLPTIAQNNKELAMLAIKRNPYHIFYFSDKLIRDPELILSVLRMDRKIARMFPRDISNDKNLAVQLFKLDNTCLQYFTEYTRSYVKVVNWLEYNDSVSV